MIKTKKDFLCFCDNCQKEMQDDELLFCSYEFGEICEDCLKSIILDEGLLPEDVIDNDFYSAKILANHLGIDFIYVENIRENKYLLWLESEECKD